MTQVTAAGGGSPITVSGLGPGQWTFTVQGVNSAGTGAASASSAAVTIAQQGGGTPTGFTRPSGSGYVTYESLHQSGDTLTQTLARCPAGSIVTFGPGAYEATDFATANDNCAIYVPKTCGGIWGSGPGSLAHSADATPPDGTYFRVKANSATFSTASSSAPSPSVLQSEGATVDQSFGQFAVVGTPQGSQLTRFTNLRLRNSPQTNRVSVTDVASYGHLGYANYPPGETFGVDIDGWTSHTMTRVLGDGRRANGIRYGSSPLTAQHCSAGTWTNCTGQYSIAGMVTFYEASGVTTNNLLAQHMGTGSGALNGSCVNHERTTGIVHNNLTLVMDGSPNTGQHISRANDDWSTYGAGESRCAPWTNGTLTINGITWNPYPGSVSPNPTLYLQDFGTEQGNPNTDSTAPVIKDSAGNLIHYRWQTSSGTVVHP